MPLVDPGLCQAPSGFLSPGPIPGYWWRQDGNRWLSTPHVLRISAHRCEFAAPLIGDGYL